MRNVESDQPPSPPQAPEAALTELLGTKSVPSYVEESGTSVAPFCLEAISWPTCAGRVPLLGVLPESSRFEAAEFEKRLKLGPDELKARREFEVERGPIGILRLRVTVPCI